MRLNFFKISANTNLLARWQSWSIASDLKSDESFIDSVGSNPTLA